MPTPSELLEVGRVALGAAAAILDEAGRILLVRHSYGRQNWELPGGMATPGESPEDTAMREVAEEIGLTVVAERVTGIYPEPGHRLGPAMTFVVLCHRNPAEARPRIDSEEIAEFGWFERSALPRPISDFTIRRIDDAGGQGPLLSTHIAGRHWLEDDVAR